MMLTNRLPTSAKWGWFVSGEARVMALKLWDDKDWTQQLSKSTIVGIADDDVGAEPDKPKFIYIGQSKKHPPVRSGAIRATSVLLSRDEARALAEYLVE